MKKYLFLTLSVALAFAACEKDDETPVPDDPESTQTDTTRTDTVIVVDSTIVSVNDYNYLKTYVDRAAHPGFKLSGALDVNEFHNNRNHLRDTVSAHFDEIVAGNAMKYGSVVNGGGNMDFSRVKQFVSDAKAAGLTIYGHTLAWHSQQQPGYLLGLMKDKELDVPDEEKVDIADIDINYKGMKSWSLWHSDFKMRTRTQTIQ